MILTWVVISGLWIEPHVGLWKFSPERRKKRAGNSKPFKFTMHLGEVGEETCWKDAVRSKEVGRVPQQTSNFT